MSNPPCKKILAKEYRQILETPVENLSVLPLGINICEWHVNITPFDSVFENVVFHVILKFPSNYPSQPPTISICHYNCCTVRGWSSNSNVRFILGQLESFLFLLGDHYGFKQIVSECKSFRCSCGHDGAPNHFPQIQTICQEVDSKQDTWWKSLLRKNRLDAFVDTFETEDLIYVDEWEQISNSELEEFGFKRSHKKRWEKLLSNISSCGRLTNDPVNTDPNLSDVTSGKKYQTQNTQSNNIPNAVQNLQMDAPNLVAVLNSEISVDLAEHNLRSEKTAPAAKPTPEVVPEPTPEVETTPAVETPEVVEQPEVDPTTETTDEKATQNQPEEPLIVKKSNYAESVATSTVSCSTVSFASSISSEFMRQSYAVGNVVDAWYVGDWYTAKIDSVSSERISVIYEGYEIDGPHELFYEQVRHPQNINKKSNKKNKNRRVNDWNCMKCGATGCFGSRSECYKCGAAKPLNVRRNKCLPTVQETFNIPRFYMTMKNAIVRKEFLKESAVVDTLEIGTIVSAISIDGNRLQINHPVSGWCSVVSSKSGNYICKYIDTSSASCLSSRSSKSTLDVEPGHYKIYLGGRVQRSSNKTKYDGDNHEFYRDNAGKVFPNLNSVMHYYSASGGTIVAITKIACRDGDVMGRLADGSGWLLMRRQLGDANIMLVEKITSKNCYVLKRQCPVRKEISRDSSFVKYLKKKTIVEVVHVRSDVHGEDHVLLRSPVGGWISRTSTEGRSNLKPVKQF